MIAFGANFDQLNKIRRSLRTQIIAANPANDLQDDFRERMPNGFATSYDRNFSLKKQIEFYGKRLLRRRAAFGIRSRKSVLKNPFAGNSAAIICVRQTARVFC